MAKSNNKLKNYAIYYAAGSLLLIIGYFIFSGDATKDTYTDEGQFLKIIANEEYTVEAEIPKTGTTTLTNPDEFISSLNDGEKAKITISDSDSTFVVFTGNNSSKKTVDLTKELETSIFSETSAMDNVVIEDSSLIGTTIGSNIVSELDLTGDKDDLYYIDLPEVFSISTQDSKNFAYRTIQNGYSLYIKGRISPTNKLAGINLSKIKSIEQLGENFLVHDGEKLHIVTTLTSSAPQYSLKLPDEASYTIFSNFFAVTEGSSVTVIDNSGQTLTKFEYSKPDIQEEEYPRSISTSTNVLKVNESFYVVEYDRLKNVGGSLTQASDIRTPGEPSEWVLLDEDDLLIISQESLWRTDGDYELWEQISPRSVQVILGSLAEDNNSIYYSGADFLNNSEIINPNIYKFDL